MLTLRFDGLFREVSDEGAAPVQAGLMGYGWLIFQGEEAIARGHGVVARRRDATCNVAEYLALIEGLEALADLGWRGATGGVTVCGDSKVVIDQMRGMASVNSPVMKPLHQRAMRLAHHFQPVDWIWTPRRENKAADLLTRKAMKQVRYDSPSYEAALESLAKTPHRKSRSNKFLTLLDLRVYGQR